MATHEQSLQGSDCREVALTNRRYKTSRGRFQKDRKEVSTPRSLAKARRSELRRMIEPLGFSYRSDELPRLAQRIQNVHKANVPNNLKDLLNLTGVGDYMARGVFSFAHGQDVTHRIFGLAGPLTSNPSRHKQLIALAAEITPTGRSKTVQSCDS